MTSEAKPWIRTAILVAGFAAAGSAEADGATDRALRASSLRQESSPEASMTITHVGAGCPAGSVTQRSLKDGMTLTFSSFRLSSLANPAARTLDCTLVIRVDAAAGWSYAALLRARGSVALDGAGTFTYRLAHGFAGAAAFTAGAALSKRGESFDMWVQEERVRATSECGRATSLVASPSITLQTPSVGSSAEVALDVFDVALAWRRCP